MSSVGGMGESAVQVSDKPAVTLHEADMPGLYKAADAASIKAQAKYFGWLRVELVLMALAGVVAVFAFLKQPALSLGPITVSGWPDKAATLVGALNGLSIVGLVTGVLFIAAMGVRLYRYQKHFDTKWYEARAAAESVKSVAWRYAVGGRPFPIGGDEVAARQLLIQRLEDTLTDVAKDLQKTAFSDDEKITPAMKRLRGESLTTREAAYRNDRIQDQEKWYLRKSVWNKNRALQWHTALVIIEGLGAVGSGLLAFHLLPFSPQGAVAAIATGIMSWIQTKRYQDLEVSYRVTASELGSIKQGIANQTTDTAWSAFVDEAEEACSREHRLWRSTRDE